MYQNTDHNPYLKSVHYSPKCTNTNNEYQNLTTFCMWIFCLIIVTAWALDHNPAAFMHVVAWAKESLLFVPTTQLSICHATTSLCSIYLSIYRMIQLQELGLNTNMSLVHHHVAHVRTRTCCKKPFFGGVIFHQVWQPKKENPVQLIQKIFVNKKKEPKLPDFKEMFS